MITCSAFLNKNVLVFGLGKTGLGAAKSLVASGANVSLLDDNKSMIDEALEAVDKTTYTPFYYLNWSEIDYLVLSPGVPVIGDNTHSVVKAARNNKVAIITDIDILYMACPDAKFIGITGTNGKSTTTALVGHILQSCGIKVEVGGNIGQSVLELNTLEGDGIYVIELSSFQLDILHSAQFDLSALINITPDHLDRHLSMENYVYAKAKIFKHLRNQGCAIISIDYPETLQISQSLSSDVCKLSISTNATDISHIDRVLKDKTRGLEFDFNGLTTLLGVHNQENISTAYAICTRLGIDAHKVVDAIKTFKGLAHRMEECLRTDDVLFINDSKATNADATEKALMCFKQVYLILGGKEKEGGITKILPLIQSNTKNVLLIGESTESFARALDPYHIPYEKVGTLDAALNNIKNDHTTHGVVLLSPACASYDQFKNFEHRGDEFKRLVRKLFG